MRSSLYNRPRKVALEKSKEKPTAALRTVHLIYWSRIRADLWQPGIEKLKLWNAARFAWKRMMQFLAPKSLITEDVRLSSEISRRFSLISYSFFSSRRRWIEFAWPKMLDHTSPIVVMLWNQTLRLILRRSGSEEGWFLERCLWCEYAMFEGKSSQWILRKRHIW